jgi:hypothetical protein
MLGSSPGNVFVFVSFPPAGLSLDAGASAAIGRGRNSCDCRVALSVPGCHLVKIAGLHVLMPLPPIAMV